MKKKPLKLLLPAIVLGIAMVSCTGDNPENQENIDNEAFDPNNSLNTVFDGKIFSIPSPVQTAYLIKSLDVQFDESLLSNDASVSSFVTDYKQALNLGIYGTDLGYSTLYDQKSVTMRYLTAVEKLSSKLGLENAFDSEFLNRFEENNGNSDSLVRLMSDAFRQADNFLKSANRKSTSALILTGGWIESMYFACELNTKKQSPDIERRIAEQKQSLYSIIDILTEYNKGNNNDSLIANLEELRMSFDKIEINYEYAAPETNEENKLTTLHHTLDINIDSAVLEAIKTKIEEIRNNIIKA